MMPMGRSRAGFLVSSATVETASNPMKAKKTTAAPVNVPVHPIGWNGFQFSAIVEGET